MNVIDIVLIVIALLAFISGWRKGLISAIGGILALVGGLLLARTYAINLAFYVDKWFAELDDKVIYIIAFALVFVAAYLLVSLLAWLVERIMKTLFLGWANRLAGGVLSVVIAAFIVSIVLNIYELADPEHRLIPEKQIESSTLYCPVLNVLPLVIPQIKFFGEENFDIENWKVEKPLAGQKQI